MDGIQELIIMADAGDLKAQEKVGISYMKGKGVTKDISKALEYFNMCAEKGSGLANYQLGKAYETGNGVVQNLDLARSYYEKSAELGYENAKNVLNKFDNNTQKIVSIQSEIPIPDTYVAPNVPKAEVLQNDKKSKSKKVCMILALLLGGLGVHNFYIGYYKKAVIQLILTLTILGATISYIWALIDMIMILTGKIVCDAKGNALQ